jgi:hypothetical protein
VIDQRIVVWRRCHEVMILARHRELSAGRLTRAEEIGRSLVRHPFVDVLYSLLRDSSAPGVRCAVSSGHRPLPVSRARHRRHLRLWAAAVTGLRPDTAGGSAMRWAGWWSGHT